MWVEAIEEKGHWSAHLDDCDHYVRIRRRMMLTNGFPLAAEMYLDAAIAPRLLTIDPQELTMVNIRPYPEEMFGIITVGATHVACTVTLDKTLAMVFGLPPRSTYFQVEARSYDQARKAAYYQRIYASTEGCALSF